MGLGTWFAPTFLPSIQWFLRMDLAKRSGASCLGGGTQNLLEKVLHGCASVGNTGRVLAAGLLGLFTRILATFPTSVKRLSSGKHAPTDSATWTTLSWNPQGSLGTHSNPIMATRLSLYPGRAGWGQYVPCMPYGVVCVPGHTHFIDEWTEAHCGAGSWASGGAGFSHHCH